MVECKTFPHLTLFWVKTTLRAGQKWCDGACLNVEECYPMGEWMLIRCKLCVFRCACEIVCLWAYGSVWRTLVADAARATGHSVYLPTGGKGGAPLITAKQTETRMSPSSEHKITAFFPVDQFIAICIQQTHAIDQGSTLSLVMLVLQTSKYDILVWHEGE